MKPLCLIGALLLCGCSCTVQAFGLYADPFEGKPQRTMRTAAYYGACSYEERKAAQEDSGVKVPR